jgi:hypothetical protein
LPSGAGDAKNAARRNEHDADTPQARGDRVASNAPDRDGRDPRRYAHPRNRQDSHGRASEQALQGQASSCQRAVDHSCRHDTNATARQAEPTRRPAAREVWIHACTRQTGGVEVVGGRDAHPAGGRHSLPAGSNARTMALDPRGNREEGQAGDSAERRSTARRVQGLGAVPGRVERGQARARQARAGQVHARWHRAECRFPRSMHVRARRNGRNAELKERNVVD